jgi:hypothetical protein
MGCLPSKPKHREIRVIRPGDPDPANNDAHMELVRRNEEPIYAELRRRGLLPLEGDTRGSLAEWLRQRSSRTGMTGEAVELGPVGRPRLTSSLSDIRREPRSPFPGSPAVQQGDLNDDNVNEDGRVSRLTLSLTDIQALKRTLTLTLHTEHAEDNNANSKYNSEYKSSASLSDIRTDVTMSTANLCISDDWKYQASPSASKLNTKEFGQEGSAENTLPSSPSQVQLGKQEPREAILHYHQVQAELVGVRLHQQLLEYVSQQKDEQRHQPSPSSTVDDAQVLRVGPDS